VTDGQTDRQTEMVQLLQRCKNRDEITFGHMQQCALSVFTVQY